MRDTSGEYATAENRSLITRNSAAMGRWFARRYAEPAADTIGQQAERIAELERELWQAKGALGYSVPGGIPEGKFTNGIAIALEQEHDRLQAKVERLREALLRAPKVQSDSYFASLLFQHGYPRWYNSLRAAALKN